MLFYLLCTVLVVRVSSDWIQREGYTYGVAGKSYAEYSPQWTDITTYGFTLKFRTFRANAFLLHHKFEGSEAEGPWLVVSLSGGSIQVKHFYNEVEEILIAGRGLNHNDWHTIFVQIDHLNGNLTLSIDDQAKTTALKCFAKGQGDRLLSEKGRRRSGLLSVGGVRPGSPQTPPPFIGCIKGVVLIENENREFTCPLTSEGDIEQGCVDRCEDGHPCQHQGRCVNHYTQTLCDCDGTGYEGDVCQHRGLTAVTLQGSEWISYQTDDDIESAHNTVSKISLHFKTTSGEGVLFYARENYPQYNHLAVSMHNTSVHVSVVYVDDDSYNELFVAVGSKLNDDRWHELEVTHHENRVDVHLDDLSERMAADRDLSYLRIPPSIFFGGIEDTPKALGLRSQVGFVGCLRSVYFNHLDVIHLLNISSPSVVFHGNGSPMPQRGCQNLANAAMQFSHSGTFTKVEHLPSDTLDVNLEFKSLKANGVLVYSEVKSRKRDTIGFIQAALKDGKIQVTISPILFDTQTQSVYVGNGLNDNHWHVLSILYHGDVIQVKIDDDLVSEVVHDVLEVSQASYIGFGPNTGMDFGYIGCIRRISVQSQNLDPVHVVHSALSAGITLGLCELIDWCNVLESPFCYNGGQCVSLWNERHCNCAKTDYRGKFCQFSNLKRSCDDLYQTGESRSGAYLLDLDGPGPLEPVNAYCEMGVEKNQRDYGVTTVAHNLEKGTLVRGPELEDMKKVLTYREMQQSHLEKLVDDAEFCSQNIQITCHNAPLRMGYQTWLVSGRGHKYTSLGGSTNNACQCGASRSCRDPRAYCNCDIKTSDVVIDGGWITEKSYLPVKELAFLQSLGGSANVTLGPLMCYGSAFQQKRSIVMFTTEQSYLSAPAWEGGDIRVMFRTTTPTAMLLYQKETKESAHLARLMVMLQDGEYVTVHSSRPQLMETVQLNNKIDTGRWQHLSLEFGGDQVRVAIDRNEFVFQTPGNNSLHDIHHDNQPLFVGGLPGHHDFSGIVGCIGGLVYNSKAHMLSDLVSQNTPEVKAECSSACDAKPCTNEAICIEMWTDYTCECSNPYSQSGRNCQNDINKDTIQLQTEQSFLSYQLPDSDEDFILRDIVFSFRTTQRTALLFYMHDHMNNFVQLEVRSRNQLVLIYNSFDQILETTVDVPGISDGLWKQVAVLSLVGSIEIHIDEASALTTEQRGLLKEYSRTPFAHAESVSPERGIYPDPAGVQVFVGGVPDYFTRRIPGLLGCFRGLKVGDRSLELSESTGKHIKDIISGCASGCLSSPCQNGGFCIDDAIHGASFLCECSETGFSGLLCEEDFGLYFDGKSLLTEPLSVNALGDLYATPTVFISLSIATREFGDQPRAIAFLRGSTGSDDYILLYLTEMGTIAVQAVIGLQHLSVEGSFHIANDKPHAIQVTVGGQKVEVKADDYVDESSMNSAETIAAPSFFTLGGVQKDDDDRFNNFMNFTGDISNAFLVSDYLRPINARPFDVYYGYRDNHLGITTVGNFRPLTHSVHIGSLYRTGYADHRMAGTENSMPPWNSGPALTVTLSQTTEAVVADSSTSLVIGVTVGILVIILIAALIAFVLYRQWNRKSSFTPERVPGDEEEGLLRMGSIVNGNVENGKKSDLPTAKLRQGPRGKKNPKGQHTDDENEETPMLQQMEKNGTSQPEDSSRIKSFGEDMGSVPMIDEAGTDADKTPLPETPNKNNLSNTDIETDPSLFAPSPQNTSTPYKSDNAPIRDDSPPPSPQSSRHSPQQSIASADSYARLPREVWTESQILSVLDAEQNSDEDNEENKSNNNATSSEDFFPAVSKLDTTPTPSISDSKAALDVPQRGSAYYSSVDSFATAPDGLSSPTMFLTPEVKSPLMDTLSESAEESSTA